MNTTQVTAKVTGVTCFEKNKYLLKNKTKPNYSWCKMKLFNLQNWTWHKAFTHCASYAFIASPLLTHLPLPCFVILELEPAAGYTSPLSAGLMVSSPTERVLEGDCKADVERKNFSSFLRCMVFLHSDKRVGIWRSPHSWPCPRWPSVQWQGSLWLRLFTIARRLLP